MKHVTNTPYYPQPSHAERFNRNFRSPLTAYHAVAQTAWDVNLSWLQLAFNTATHEATENTPFEIGSFQGGVPVVKQMTNSGVAS
jgi:hypothetical protein